MKRTPSRLSKIISGIFCVVCLLILLCTLMYSLLNSTAEGLKNLLVLLFFALVIAAGCWLAVEYTALQRRAKAEKAKTAAPQPEPQEESLPVRETALVTCPGASYPPLSDAIESGPVGMGQQSQHLYDGNIHITTTATEQVRYYYFPDGTLVFIGTGKTKSVDPGGHDGRHSYEPENPPWSETVQANTVRAIFTEGITLVGSGLLQSLCKLQELILADSVKMVDHNRLRHLQVLKAGKNFKAYHGSTGKLTQLQLPEGPIHFDYSNSGNLPGARSDDPAVQAILDEKLHLEFEQEMQQLFRLYPGVADKLGPISRFNKVFAARAIFSLNWNSKYRTSRLVGAEDLPKLHGLSQKSHHKKPIKIELMWEYGFHAFIYAAALVHAALLTSPEQLHCKTDAIQWDDDMTRWWNSVFPDVALTITMKNGDVFSTTSLVCKQTEPSNVQEVKPTDQSSKAAYPRDLARVALSTLTKKELKAVQEQEYQYHQDVQRGGTDPEQAAANRGFVLIDGKPCPKSVLAAMDNLKHSTPYYRANQPYEVAGPHAGSLYEAEIAHFLILSPAYLADELGWGQQEFYMVDTRDWSPWYVLTQYDGAHVAHTWYHIKEQMTWDEIDRYADPVAKKRIGHSIDTPWRDCALAYNATDDGCSIRWRSWRHYHFFELTLRRFRSGWIVSLALLPGNNNKPKKKELSAADCATQAAFAKALAGLGVTQTLIIQTLWDYLYQNTSRLGSGKAVRKTLSQEIAGAKRHKIYGHDSGHGPQVSVGLIPNSHTCFVEVTEDGYPNPGASGGFNRALPKTMLKDGKIKVGDVLTYLGKVTQYQFTPDDPEKWIHLD